ncbi:hypothetical protein ABZU75_09500 [Streptosporangium sp. NPDC005286]|uniref:hypothetical protein n=1 Tax=Streptosporangium sp. NPDC005286 TaxID=3154463 RepID=UPI0033A960F5
MLLYAQPLTRVVQLTVDDLLRDGEAMFLRLGDPPSPVPEPVASLLLDYIAARDNMNTATNRASRRLFPGRRAGQPCRPDHLSALPNKIGIPAAAARGAAVRQQLLEMPAPSSPTPSAIRSAAFGSGSQGSTAQSAKYFSRGVGQNDGNQLLDPHTKAEPLPEEKPNAT